MFHDFLSSADFFSKLTFSKNSFRNNIRGSNKLDPDQDRHPVSPDLGPECLQKSSADNARRQRVKPLCTTKNLQQTFSKFGTLL